MSLLSWWYGTDADVQRIQEADAKIREINDARGISNANLDATAITQASAEAELSDAFGQGIDEGAANIKGAINATAGAVTGTFFKIVPWWVWPLVLIAIAFYFWPVIRAVLKARPS